jgi:hypothetical protein
MRLGGMACSMIEVTCVRILLQFLLLIEFFPKKCYVVPTNNNNKGNSMVHLIISNVSIYYDIKLITK